MNHFNLWRRLLVALFLGLVAPWLGAIQLVPMTSTALSSHVCSTRLVGGATRYLPGPYVSRVIRRSSTTLPYSSLTTRSPRW